MKSLTLFLQQVLLEQGELCGNISTSRDFKTIAARVESEGISFLTITLPSFAKDFEKSLDQGQVTDTLFTGFQRRGKLPVFLGGFLRQVFDEYTGRLIDIKDTSSEATDASTTIDAIRAIRQITLLYSKVLLPASDARVAKAFRAYIDCEQGVRDSDRRLWSSNSFEDFCLTEFEIFFSVVLSGMLSVSSTTPSYDRFMVLVQLLTTLEETLSMFSKSGLGDSSLSSLMGSTLRRVGVFFLQGSPTYKSLNPERKDL